MGDETDEEKTDAEPKPEPPGSRGPSRRRDPRFRIGLLDRLPRLEFTSWSVKTDFPVDEEWTGIVSLHSDSVLGPLEPLAPHRRGG
jgi:hypothetical protein